MGQVSEVRHYANSVEFRQEDYGCDVLGNLTSRAIVGKGTHTYGYDEINQLTSEHIPAMGSLPATDLAYTYDSNGNRLSRTMTTWLPARA